MQPITRETVLVDRRQPALRWSAVFAASICSIGFWILLQLIGVGIGLTAVDIDDLSSLRGVGMGTTAWSLISPLIAMFLGGVIAGKLAQTYDRKLAGGHGLVMWALTSIVGLCATIWIVSMIAAGTSRHHGALDGPGGMAWDGEREPAAMRQLGLDTAEILDPINDRLAAQRKPTITVAQFEAALRGVMRSGIRRGSFDQELLADQLVAHTRLSRADAVEVERQVEAQLGTSDTQPHALERTLERHALDATNAAGKALATVGLSLLLSLFTAVLGAVLALHRPRRKGEPRRSTRTTEPGFSPVEPATTSPPFPTPTTPMTGPATPVVPPHDINEP
jgi:hypothetical protein